MKMGLRDVVNASCFQEYFSFASFLTRGHIQPQGLFSLNLLSLKKVSESVGNSTWVTEEKFRRPDFDPLPGFAFF